MTQVVGDQVSRTQQVLTLMLYRLYLHIFQYILVRDIAELSDCKYFYSLQDAVKKPWERSNSAEKSSLVSRSVDTKPLALTTGIYA